MAYFMMTYEERLKSINDKLKRMVDEVKSIFDEAINQEKNNA